MNRIIGALLFTAGIATSLVGVESSAIAETRHIDTDGVLDRNEYRNPNIRYHYDGRDYEPRDYQVRYYDKFRDDDYRHYGWNHPTKRWGSYGWDRDRDCDHRAEPVRFDRRPYWWRSYW